MVHNDHPTTTTMNTTAGAAATGTDVDSPSTAAAAATASPHELRHTTTVAAASPPSSSSSSSSPAHHSSSIMDEEEDEEEEEDHQDMDYWLQRCSICFDAQLDLCLEYCRDQYCLDCFRRYVTEVVTTSWGLSVTKIRCPVCQDHIPQSEWSKFVPSSVVELYNRYNQPYRSFSRCCPSCETEVTPVDYRDRHHGGPKRVYDMLKDLLRECSHEEQQQQQQQQQQHNNMTNDPEHVAIRKLLPIIERQEWNSSSLPALYRRTLLAVRAFERSHHHHRHAITAAPAAVAPATTESQAQTTILSPSSATAVHPWSHRPLATPITATTATSAALAISKSMLLFDMKPDTWRKLQFQHISFFPIIDCPACLVTFCLQCGQREHPNATCEESMQRTVDSNHRGLPSEAIETLRWQLQNSRRCPNCSIMINRDEGCNKVDCSLCGFCFCWACRSPWSEKCGFYHCSEATQGDQQQLSSTSPELSQVQTELGVPNVSSIQARLFPLTGAP